MFLNAEPENTYFPLTESLLKKPILKIANVQHRDSYYHFAKHIHSNMEMYLILSGSCGMEIGNQTITCQEGDFVLILPNIPHSFYLCSEETCSFRHVHCYPDLFALLLLDAPSGFSMDLLTALKLYQQSFYFLPADSFLDASMERLVTLAESGSPFSTALSNLAVTELLIHLIGLYKKTNHIDSQPDAVQNQYALFTLKFIHENYASKFHIDDIADALNISSRYLRKTFVDYMHINIQSYIKTFRMNKAVELMVHTDMNLTEIAAAVGINDSQYFSKLFHNTIGSAPSEYRKIIKNTEGVPVKTLNAAEKQLPKQHTPTA